ncbi:purine-nucleoside phosphorylase [Desulfurella sp.]|uniref:purine-nucleoside phosphorylase n=1 Tax=Desulfurella sp. TaxID=1962857 RepID=UPI0025C587A3|nr:purine-nucleoside phosphorylase [Desulfurella sp.]
MESKLGKSDICIITGTGIKFDLKSFTKKKQIDYSEFDLPKPTTSSHKGYFEIFEGNNLRIIVANGRFHYYEGLSPSKLRALPEILCKTDPKLMILTNSTGGLDPFFKKGDLMVIRDHINLTNTNPLIGIDSDNKFVDMVDAYSPYYIEKLKESALRLSIDLKEGVYVGVSGPSLETPAETRFLRLIGASCVAMSLINETIVSRFFGIDVLGISIITNVNKPDCMGKIPIEEVINQANLASKKLSVLLDDFLLKNDFNKKRT